MRLRGFLIGLVLVVDQLSKYLVLRYKFSSTIIENPGLFLGINLPGFFNLLTLFVVLLIFIFVYLREVGISRTHLGFWLIVAGAISNLYDRAVDGKVTDFINLKIATLNFADFAIMGGIVLLLISNVKAQMSK